MNVLADYVQPLTNWLQENPSWSLFITFLISLAESLAIVGTLVPGSVTMTAIGILAGSGIMRVDLTLIAAILGAICGDSLSYAIGYVYSDSLAYIWPFNKYPNLLKYGKDFFEKHGGKSVLIGRFVGPLRSIIPVVAGIMRMQQWRFLLANVLSAIGWSFLYVIPGVLIGTAEHELSATGTNRLFFTILLLILGLWFIGLLVTNLFRKFNPFLQRGLHRYWLNQMNHSRLTKIYHLITPSEDENYYMTALWFFTAVVCLLSALGLFFLQRYTQLLDLINTPIDSFIQSIHNRVLTTVCIICSYFTTKITLACLFLACTFSYMTQKNSRLLTYLASILVISFIVAILFNTIFFTQKHGGSLVSTWDSAFPLMNHLMFTAFYSFILLYIGKSNTFLVKPFRTLILIILGLTGFSLLYLRNYYFTDILTSYLLGVFICLSHWLVYRKESLDSLNDRQRTLMILALIIALVLSTTLISFIKLTY